MKCRRVRFLFVLIASSCFICTSATIAKRKATSNLTDTQNDVVPADIRKNLTRPILARNQGDVLAFPIVAKIRSKVKHRPESTGNDEQAEEVDELVRSLNHRKSGTYDRRHGAIGTAPYSVYVVRPSSTGEPYSLGYQGRPESQLPGGPAEAKGKLTSGTRGRNSFGSYGSIDTPKGQASLERAITGTNYGTNQRGDDYDAYSAYNGDSMSNYANNKNYGATIQTGSSLPQSANGYGTAGYPPGYEVVGGTEEPNYGGWGFSSAPDSAPAPRHTYGSHVTNAGSSDSSDYYQQQGSQSSTGSGITNGQTAGGEYSSGGGNYGERNGDPWGQQPYGGNGQENNNNNGNPWGDNMEGQPWGSSTNQNSQNQQGSYEQPSSYSSYAGSQGQSQGSYQNSGYQETSQPSSAGQQNYNWGSYGGYNQGEQTQSNNYGNQQNSYSGYGTNYGNPNAAAVYPVQTTAQQNVNYGVGDYYGQQGSNSAPTYNAYGSSNNDYYNSANAASAYNAYGITNNQQQQQQQQQQPSPSTSNWGSSSANSDWSTSQNSNNYGTSQNVNYGNVYPVQSANYGDYYGQQQQSGNGNSQTYNSYGSQNGDYYGNSGGQTQSYNSYGANNQQQVSQPSTSDWSQSQGANSEWGSSQISNNYGTSQSGYGGIDQNQNSWSQSQQGQQQSYGQYSGGSSQESMTATANNNNNNNGWGLTNNQEGYEQASYNQEAYSQQNYGAAQQNSNNYNSWTYPPTSEASIQTPQHPHTSYSSYANSKGHQQQSLTNNYSTNNNQNNNNNYGSYPYQTDFPRNVEFNVDIGGYGSSAKRPSHSNSIASIGHLTKTERKEEHPKTVLTAKTTPKPPVVTLSELDSYKAKAKVL